MAESKNKPTKRVSPEKQAKLNAREEAKANGPKKHKSKGKIAAIVLIVLALLCAGGVAAWMFWIQPTYFPVYDDAADIQGEWLIEDEAITVVISEDEIRMPNDITFKYVLDQDAGTIELTNDKATATDTYSFSDNRKEVTIVEQVNGEESTLVLEKLSKSTSAEPQKNYDKSEEASKSTDDSSEKSSSSDSSKKDSEES
jgi:hypothetical protein